MCPSQIGTLKETSLHADLKRWYAQPGDQQEVKLEGYFIDLVRGELLVEIQTRHFHHLKTKLSNLLETHPVRLVYPVAYEKWIVKQDEQGRHLPGRRKSPRRGRIEHIFLELIRIPTLIAHPNFTLEVVLTREEEIRQDDGRGSWRRAGWSIYDRRLLEVIETRLFTNEKDFASLLPSGLPEIFTVHSLASKGQMQRSLASKMAYCLRQMEVVEVAGKIGRAYQYRILPPSSPFKTGVQ